MPLLA